MSPYPDEPDDRDVTDLFDRPPEPINWNALDAEHADIEWHDLDRWVKWLKVTFGLPPNIVPPYWHRHDELIWELSALHCHCSLWTRDVEDEILPLLRELGIGFVPYSPLGHGMLTGQIRSVDDFPDDDWRKDNPRFIGENFHRNLRIVDEVRAIGAEIGATPAQTALAWILTKGDDFAPIPGTRRVARVEENTAADAIELTANQIERLNTLTPAAGARHNDDNMSSIDR